MTIGVLALVGVTPERVAALTAAGYAVREGKKYANRTDAVREAADTVRAVLTNGRGGLSGDEMALLPQLEIVCAVGAGYEAVDLDTARRRGIVVANCPDANAPAVADSAMMLLLAQRGTCCRPIASSVPVDGRSNGGSRPRPLRASAWGFSGSETSGAGLRSAPRAASTWRSAITTGRRSPAPPIAISPVSSSSRRGPISWSPPRRGRGDAAPRQRGRARGARTARLSRQRRARDGRGYPGADRSAAIEARGGGWPGCPRG